MLLMLLAADANNAIRSGWSVLLLAG